MAVCRHAHCSGNFGCVNTSCNVRITEISLTAGFAATVFLITKYAVLERKNPVRNALYISPLYFFTVTAVLTMSIGRRPLHYLFQGADLSQYGRARRPSSSTSFQAAPRRWPLL